MTTETYTILPNKKGKVIVKNLRTKKEQTIEEHLKYISKRDKRTIAKFPK